MVIPEYLARCSESEAVSDTQSQPMQNDAASLAVAPNSAILVETDQEEDGRWIAEVVGRPGALAYHEDENAAIVSALEVAGLLVARRSSWSNK